MIARPDDFASLIWPMLRALGRAASGFVFRPMPMRPRTIALLRRMRVMTLGGLAVTAAMMTVARLMTAAFVSMRLTMAMTMGTARLFHLAALLLGQFRQLVRHQLDLHADQPLDVAQIAFFGSIAEADGNAFAAGPRGAADTVHIAFRL